MHHNVERSPNGDIGIQFMAGVRDETTYMSLHVAANSRGLHIILSEPAARALYNDLGKTLNPEETKPQ